MRGQATEQGVPIIAAVGVVVMLAVCILTWRLLTNPVGTLVQNLENSASQPESKSVLGQMSWLWAIIGIGLVVAVLVYFFLFLHQRERGWWWQ
jgi:phosphoglycerol transferase MdoB-like AlkP superfamily enzyme